MKLAERCSHSFAPHVRARGQAYFENGFVFDLSVDFGLIEALVSGSAPQPYEVLIDVEYHDSQTLIASCTCPYYETEGLCKHIWAVLLSVDTSEVGISARDRSPIEVLSEDEEEDYGFGDYGHDDGDDDDDDDYADDGDDYLDGGFAEQFAPLVRLAGPGRSQTGRTSPTRPVPWQRHLQEVARTDQHRAERVKKVLELASGKRRELWYLLNLRDTQQENELILELYRRDTKKNGELGKAQIFRHMIDSTESLSLDEDRWILGFLGASPYGSTYGSPYAYRRYSSYDNPRVMLSSQLHDLVLPRLCATGRLRILHAGPDKIDEATPLAWDDGPPYRLRIAVETDDQKKRWILHGQLCRDAEMVPIDDPIVLLHSGIAVFRDRLSRFDATKGLAWVRLFRRETELSVPYAERWEFLQNFLQHESAPEIDLPEEFHLSETRVPPQPILRVHKPRTGSQARDLEASIAFDYDGTVVGLRDDCARIVLRDTERIIFRDPAREAELVLRLSAWNVRLRNAWGWEDGQDVSFLARRLGEMVSALTAEGWVVEAEGIRVRQPGAFSGGVSSGVDWFELEGQFDYGNGAVASLPDLLDAVRHGQTYVRLSDGSQGLLPEKWLAKYGPLAELGEAGNGKLRFSNSQAALLDALLAAQDNVHVDHKFSELRQRLRSFDGIKPGREPKGFVGELRQYQRQGLGWLQFLQSFNLGGCLADDMGLGKTIQLLAHLQQQRVTAQAEGPSMIVVPRTLVFNWLDEAARFAPRLKLRDYTGLKRAGQLDEIEPGDILVTTYGTMRRDIVKLKDIRFDYVILDEAQAIKNSGSQAAKAARLLQARHRLALTGTPIENHLGELWSLFEFLNPGMLGHSTVFHKCWKNGQTDADNIELLRASLAPFILRRTKEQVLPELPRKTEQTLYCELDRQERKAYDQLRKYYRDSLQEKIEKQGLERAKIHVLEALLRLRQAACHRGLLDKSHAKGSSAKLDSLLEQVAEIGEEGHKALVFSQFTSLQSIVRHHLDQRGIVYEYLDGQTRKRDEHVRRFQTDPDCRLFLISLKAGGHGLNLTAADYVFILDPWWNPAVEAQAVDRTHRIGQTRPVFAYRLIARETVEEKILELQQSKRNLAEAIISADGSVMQRLTAEDLQILLS